MSSDEITVEIENSSIGTVTWKVDGVVAEKLKSLPAEEFDHKMKKIKAALEPGVMTLATAAALPLENSDKAFALIMNTGFETNLSLGTLVLGDPEGE